MSPAPLTEELRDELQRVERALTDVTLDEFFRIMMNHHMQQQADSVRGIVAERINQAKQVQRAVIAACREGHDSTPFDGPDEDYEDEDGFIHDAEDEEETETCVNCDGDGEVQCEECGGTGMLDDEGGDDSLEITCHECSGSGYHPCDECGGTGDA
jgi:hypothetical protein